MGLFKLSNAKQEISEGKLIQAAEDQIDYEASFECWLENSPDVLFENVSNTVLWIGRQETVDVGEVKKFPDLIGIDGNGDVVIVELKKGRTPRDVIAQIMEYCSWAVNLKYEDLNSIYKKYMNKNGSGDTDLRTDFDTLFNPDNEEINIVFNNSQKLFIVAEEISPIITQVANYLRSKGIGIYGLEYRVHKTEMGEILVQTERKVWDTNISYVANEQSDRWNEEVLVKDAVADAVNHYTQRDKTKIFSPTDIYKNLIVQYPSFKRNTLNCQLISDAVNHTSRKHYPGGQTDRYFWEGKGKYRLYDPEKDGKWDDQGERVD